MAAPRSSVSTHRFGSTPPYTVGLEEEYMLLDPETLDLVQRAGVILDADREGEFASLTSSELFQSELEGHTPVCGTVVEAEAALRRLRAHLDDVVASAGLVLGSSGTHPFAWFEHQLLTEKERYLRLVEQLQYLARRELIFGLHVHVGVPDPETAIAVTTRLRPHVADLVALSASSPFWRGSATGLRSTRHSVFTMFPRSGLPPAFADYAEFDSLVEALERGGFAADYTRIWWDVRPHPRLGTVEVRAMDAVARVEDAVALAAYVQALVLRFAREPRPPRAGALDDALLAESKWQAVRHGLDATVVREGRCGPLADEILRTLEELAPAADELGSASQLARVERIVREGTGADRQLAVYAESGDIGAVARSIVEETRAGLGAGV
jgi:carboxylate-amine ligase